VPVEAVEFLFFGLPNAIWFVDIGILLLLARFVFAGQGWEHCSGSAASRIEPHGRHVLPVGGNPAFKRSDFFQRLTANVSSFEANVYPRFPGRRFAWKARGSEDSSLDGPAIPTVPTLRLRHQAWAKAFRPSPV